jgi:formylglycine-generating enzyme required for sulfatase activity
MFDVANSGSTPDADNDAQAGLTEATDEETMAAADGNWFGNAGGLCAMIGNVMEWCEDNYFEDYKSGPSHEKPRKLDMVDPQYLARGGACNTLRRCFSTGRCGRHSDGLGFRICRSLP